MIRRASIRDERGGTAAGNVIWAVMLLIVSGIGIDVTHAFSTRAAMQATADAAVLAAAQDLPDADAAARTALRYVELNLPAARHGDMADAGDVVVGVWDAAARRVGTASAGAPPDAVALTLRRGAGQGDPLPMFLLRLIGLDGWDVAVHAAAEHRWTPPLCGGGGLFSGADLAAGSGTAWPAGTCLHGEGGVALGHGNAFAERAILSLPGGAPFSEAGDNPGAADALRRRGYGVPLALAAAPTIEAALAGGAVPMPAALGARVTVSALPPDPQPGTLYVVTGPDPVEFADGAVLDRLGVIAAGGIRLGDGVVLTDVVLMARGPVVFGRKARLGAADPCAGGRYGVHVLAAGDVRFGDGGQLSGTVLAAGGRLDLGHGLAALDAVHAEAAAGLDHGGASRVGACPGRLRSDYEDLPLAAAAAGALPTGAVLAAGGTLVR